MTATINNATTGQETELNLEGDMFGAGSVITLSSGQPVAQIMREYNLRDFFGSQTVRTERGRADGSTSLRWRRGLIWRSWRRSVLRSMRRRMIRSGGGRCMRHRLVAGTCTGVLVCAMGASAVKEASRTAGFELALALNLIWPALIDPL